MTVLTPVTSVTRKGNGLARVYPFAPMRLTASTDITVVHTDDEGTETTLTEGTGTTNYSVQVKAYPGTGYIIYPADSSGTALPDDEYLTISLDNIARTQAVALANYDAYAPDDVEEALDKLTLLYRQLDIKLNSTDYYIAPKHRGYAYNAWAHKLIGSTNVSVQDLSAAVDGVNIDLTPELTHNGKDVHGPCGLHWIRFTPAGGTGITFTGAQEGCTVIFTNKSTGTTVTLVGSANNGTFLGGIAVTGEMSVLMIRLRGQWVVVNADADINQALA
ncbi:MAG: hypothetical protein VW405_06110 [Rhodospirillaceae bacterium]